MPLAPERIDPETEEVIAQGQDDPWLKKSLIKVIPGFKLLI